MHSFYFILFAITGTVDLFDKSLNRLKSMKYKTTIDSKNESETLMRFHTLQLRRILLCLPSAIDEPTYNTVEEDKKKGLNELENMILQQIYVSILSLLQKPPCLTGVHSSWGRRATRPRRSSACAGDRCPRRSGSPAARRPGPPPAVSRA